ncbi:MAG: pentapeptide repeat-containing protein [Gemmatimonadaceae bacterium]|nr:pentapeptide repeat-containing protein [Gemmatimonadaceae bacterium]
MSAIVIKNRRNDSTLWEGEAESRGAAALKAFASGVNLTGADLTRANLSDAALRDADLRSIRADFFDVLMVVPREVGGLRAALVEGRIDGSTYTGDCACLVGTIAHVAGLDHCKIPGLKPNSSRPAERWFFAIQPGDTPETSQVAAITLEWIDQFLAVAGEPAATA